MLKLCSSGFKDAGAFMELRMLWVHIFRVKSDARDSHGVSKNIDGLYPIDADCAHLAQVRRESDPRASNRPLFLLSVTII